MNPAPPPQAKWPTQELSIAVGPAGRVIGGPFGSDLVQKDYCASGVPVIRVTNQEGAKIGGEFVFVSEAKASKLAANIAYPTDIIVVQRGSTVGKVSRIPADSEFSRFVVCQSQMAVTVDPNHADPEFIFQCLRSPQFEKYVQASAIQTGQPHINLEILRRSPIIFPPVQEQRRIAAMLKAWDDALDALDRLRASLSARRTALRRAVFAEPHAGDNTSTLSEISTRITRSSDGADHPLMTIASQSGFVLQSDKYARHMAGESAQNYTLVRRGEFAYNKGNSLTYPQGCVFRLERESALVPFVYFCFALNEGLNPDYYAQLFAAGYLNPQLARMIKTGVRNNGLLNINADEFFTCTVPVPGDNQQAADAAILDDADAELRAVEAEIEQVKAQKRGLMQKLLTGEWRVPETVMAEVA